MRRLKEVWAVFKEKTGTIYKITWEEMAEGAKIWEKHLLESNEYPRAELDEAIDDMGRFLIAACMVGLTESETRRNVEVTRIVTDYKSVRKVSVTADVNLPTGYSIALHGPMMPCQPRGGELDEAVDKLQEECFRYIDGDRAQQKLFDEDEEGEA